MAETDLDSLRVERLGSHFKARGISPEAASNMNEHEARHHMSQAGIVNIPQHEEIWHRTVSSMASNGPA